VSANEEERAKMRPKKKKVRLISTVYTPAWAGQHPSSQTEPLFKPHPLPLWVLAQLSALLLLT